MLQILKLRKSNRKRGFTLIEMIVVVAIIAILIALLVPNVMKFVETANSTAEKAAAKTVYVAAQVYAVDCILGKNIWDGISGGTGRDIIKAASFSEYITDTGNLNVESTGDTRAYFEDGILLGVQCALKNGKTIVYPSSFTPW